MAHKASPARVVLLMACLEVQFISLYIVHHYGRAVDRWSVSYIQRAPTTPTRSSLPQGSSMAATHLQTIAGLIPTWSPRVAKLEAKLGGVSKKEQTSSGLLFYGSKIPKHEMCRISETLGIAMTVLSDTSNLSTVILRARQAETIGRLDRISSCSCHVPK